MTGTIKRRAHRDVLSSSCRGDSEGVGAVPVIKMAHSDARRRQLASAHARTGRIWGGAQSGNG